MSVYPDSGFLCSLYSLDAHTARAQTAMQAQVAPLGFTPLHTLELRNALRLRVFRKESTQAHCASALNNLQNDLASGVYIHLQVTWNEAAMEAERLSAAHTVALGTRSLDILHVGFALAAGAKEFLTFDKRQGELAKAAGLKVPKL